MQLFEDKELTSEQILNYQKLELEMESIAKDLEKPEVKNSIELQHNLFKKYLSLSDEQNKIVKHGRKRRLKDKMIKELLDYTDAMLELKTKSITGFNRAKDNFKRLMTSRLSKVKNVKKRG
jgi:translation initiation factor 2 alpha subunit (eIF-2alpha)